MTTDRPNLLYVFADQMRGFDMRCAGNQDIETPHMDRLAAGGTRFDHAFANAPVCTPSRGIMLTGQFPLRHRATVNDLPLGDLPSVADLLGQAGYRTGYVGKWHLDGVPRTRFTPPGPRRHGFEYWAAYNCSHHYFRPDKYYLDDPDPVLVEGYEPEVQTDLACSFIRDRPSEPFALYLSWGPPHDPYSQVPERFRQKYDATSIKHRPNADFSTANPLAENLDPDRTLADYYAAITALDEQLGRLLDALEETGATDDTIVVFTSDHGDMLWSHGRMKKQQPWDESIRIPLIARWPGHIPAGAVSDALISTIDYLPTVLGLMGVMHEAPIAGNDLSEIVLGRSTNGNDSIFLMDIMPVDEGERQGVTEWRGVRTATHTYVELLGREPWLLYNNAHDPYQLSNLVDQPEHAAVQKELADQLDSWLARAHDGFQPGIEHLRELGLEDSWEERQVYMQRSRRSKAIET